MRFSSVLTIVAILFGIITFTSCSYKPQQSLFEQQNPPSIDSALAKNSSNGSGTSDYHIKSQDILQIRNLQSTKYIVDAVPTTAGATSSASGASDGTTYQVEDDGTVTLPAIGHIPVIGLTRAEAAKKIENLYRDSLLKNPIIELKIVNLKVTVLGEAKVQGNFPLVKDKTTLVEMIGEAGGLTEKADEKTIKIIRGDPKNPQVAQVDLSKITTLADPRIILENNDIIYIAQNKRSVKNDNLSNFSTTVQPIILLINTALIIFTLTRR